MGTALKSRTSFSSIDFKGVQMSEMNEQIEALISEIAAIHGLVVSHDDPILILHTLNSRLLDENTKASKGQLDNQKQELEGMSLRFGKDIREKSERLLNATFAASREAATNLIQESADIAAASARAEIATATTTVRRELGRGRATALFNLLASCITMLAAIVVFFAIHVTV